MERLPGFRDFFPEPRPNADVWSAEARAYVFERWRLTANRYGFREYDGPPLETLDIYTKKSGQEIVGQLYNFIDKGNRPVALRPEMTPTLARMIGSHERNYRKPIKWYAIPQLFRYERQQKGRLREHFQFNADILGESDPAADAELMAMLIDSLRSFGLSQEDFALRLSSRAAWHDFFKKHCNNPDHEYDFYQVIDKLEREDPGQTSANLKQMNISLDAVNEFIHSGQPTADLASIVNNLSARGMSAFVKVDYKVIRGLAYYTGPVYEAFDKKGQFRAIAGGGRYDNLVNIITDGKVQLPAAGFGMGDVVLIELLTERGLLPKFAPSLDAFCLIEDEDLRPGSLQLIQQLRDAGLAVDYPLAPAKADKQFKRALDSNAAHTIRLEKSASGQTTARIKNLQTRTEIIVNVSEARDAICRSLHDANPDE